MRKASSIVAAMMLGVGSWSVPEALAQPPKDVVVVNAPTAPIPVTIQKNFDNPALQPFQQFLAGAMDDGELNMGDELAVTVPAGKRLVIETVSAIVTTGAGQNVRIRVDATAGGAAAHHLTVSKEPWQASFDHTGIQSGRMYADPGTTVYIRVVRDQSTGIAVVNAAISGYFVNVPENERAVAGLKPRVTTDAELKLRATGTSSAPRRPTRATHGCCGPSAPSAPRPGTRALQPVRRSCAAR